MKNLYNILQHFEKSEEKFVRKIYNNLEEVKYNLYEKHLFFLDPRELDIVVQLANMFEVEIIKDGKYEDSERKYVIAYSKDMGYVPEIKLCIYELKYNTKFNTLTHKQIMGTLLNTGIDYSLVGDIIVSQDQRIQLILSLELAQILRITVFKYAGIKVEYILKDEIDISPIPGIRRIYSAKSLRIDSICKMLSKVSRTKMAKNILKGDVRIDFRIVDSIKEEVQENNLISIRGIGRFKIIKISKVNQKYNIVYDEQV